MVANCAQLRQSLAHLQSQLNVLTINKNDTKDEPPKSEKQKKSKSKKNKGEKPVQKSDVDKIGSAKDSEYSVEELSSTKEITGKEQQEVLTGNLNQVSAGSEEKLDEKVVENLIEAINIANVKLCSLEDASYETNEIVNETTNNVVEDEPLEIVINESIELLKDDSNEKEQNISSENLNGTSPVKIVPVEMSHIPGAISNSNEIP